MSDKEKKEQIEIYNAKFIELNNKIIDNKISNPHKHLEKILYALKKLGVIFDENDWSEDSEDYLESTKN